MSKQINRKAYEEVLSSIEISKLELLAQDEVMIKALKKVLLFGVYYNGTLKKGEDANPLMNFALRIDEQNILTDAQVGAILRAKTEGLATVEGGFGVIELFKPVIVEEKVIEKNPGR